MTMQETPMTLRARSGELQALSSGASRAPAMMIGRVASRIQMAEAKIPVVEIAPHDGAERAEEESFHIRPEIADDGGERRDLHGGGKGRARILPAEQRRHDAHMGGRGNRQKFGNALHHAEQADLGIAQRDETGVEALCAGIRHVLTPF